MKNPGAILLVASLYIVASDASLYDQSRAKPAVSRILAQTAVTYLHDEGHESADLGYRARHRPL